MDVTGCVNRQHRDFFARCERFFRENIHCQYNLHAIRKVLGASNNLQIRSAIFVWENHHQEKQTGTNR